MNEEMTHGTRRRPQIHVPAAAMMVQKKGSDLFITAGFPPAIKVDGKMTPVTHADADAAAHAGTGARDHERQAGGRVRGDQGMQLRHLARPASAASASMPSCSRGASAWCCAPSTRTIPEVRGPQAAAGAEGRGDDQARPGDVRRRHRLGQVDLAGGDDRLPQPEQLRPHHHHRGSGRVRA